MADPTLGRPPAPDPAKPDHATRQQLAAELRLDLIEYRLTRTTTAERTVEQFGAMLSGVELSSARMSGQSRAAKLSNQIRDAMTDRYGSPSPTLRAAIEGSMVPFAPGWLDMGDYWGKYTEVIRPATITAPFELSAYEVTVWQYMQLDPDYAWPIGTYADAALPSHPADLDSFPALNLNWYQARAFAEWIEARLPAEAEWEFALRESAVPGGHYCDGGDSVESLDAVGWYLNNSQHQPRRVGEKEPCGELYDMHGNALEWVNDWNVAGPKQTDLRGLPYGGPGRRRAGDPRWIVHELCTLYPHIEPRLVGARRRLPALRLPARARRRTPVKPPSERPPVGHPTQIRHVPIEGRQVIDRPRGIQRHV